MGRKVAGSSPAVAATKTGVYQNAYILKVLQSKMHLYLFGSTTRDGAGEDSDVDLFFDHPEGSLGLFALVEVKETAALL